MKRLNLRRGLNRIYLVISILWCLWVLWLPIQGRNDDYRFFAMSANGSYEWCQQARVKSLQQCEDEREAKLAEADRNILAKNPYLRVTDGSYVGLLRFPVDRKSTR